MKPLEIAAQHGLIFTAWPKLNKQDRLTNYIDQLHYRAGYGIGFCWTKVTETVCLTCDEWERFTRSLLSEYPWLAGKGGCGGPIDGIGRYTEAVMVVRPGIDDSVAILVDPQGYSYARYVGFYVDPESRKITNPPGLPTLEQAMSTTLNGVAFAERVLQQATEGTGA